jgi:hypothetical protein
MSNRAHLLTTEMNSSILTEINNQGNHHIKQQNIKSSDAIEKNVTEMQTMTTKKQIHMDKKETEWSNPADKTNTDNDQPVSFSTVLPYLLGVVTRLIRFFTLTEEDRLKAGISVGYEGRAEIDPSSTHPFPL